MKGQVILTITVEDTDDPTELEFLVKKHEGFTRQQIREAAATAAYCLQELLAGRTPERNACMAANPPHTSGL